MTLDEIKQQKEKGTKMADVTRLGMQLVKVRERLGWLQSSVEDKNLNYNERFYLNTAIQMLDEVIKRPYDFVDDDEDK